MRFSRGLRSDAAFAIAAAVAFLLLSLAISLGAQFFFPVHGWLFPLDFFALMRDAHIVLWGGYGIVYSPGFGQTGHPLGALSLVPLAEFSSLMHYVEPFPMAFPRPVIWLWSLGYMAVFLSIYVLAALRAYARLELPASRRRWAVGASALLAAFCLFPWGHPEDVAALALTLFAFADLQDGSKTRAAYLAGAAAAFQPLTLLCLMPLALMQIKGVSRLAPFVLRAAVIPLAVTIPAMAGDFSGSLSSLLSQAQSAKQRYDRPTLWVSLLQAHHGVISTTLLRVAMLLVALGIGIVLRVVRRNAAFDARTVLVVCSLGLSLRAFLEPTEVAYYLSPYLAIGAVAVVGASPRWRAFAFAWVAFGFAQMGVVMSRLSALNLSLVLWPLALAGVLAGFMSLPEGGRRTDIDPSVTEAAPSTVLTHSGLDGSSLEEVGG